MSHTTSDRPAGSPRNPSPVPGEGRPASATNLERELGRLGHVQAARVVTDRSGRPVEIHVLASSQKHPKQIVRDVQSVAMAAFGIELDRRMVSVVQLRDDDARPLASLPPGEPGAERPRVVLGGIEHVEDGVRSTVTVQMRRGEDVVTGRSEGSSASSARLRLVALATLDALRHFEPRTGLVDLATAMVVHTPERDVALTTFVLLTADGEETITGSAVVRERGEVDAMARSVLDATNRRLHMIQPPAAS